MRQYVYVQDPSIRFQIQRSYGTWAGRYEGRCAAEPYRALEEWNHGAGFSGMPGRQPGGTEAEAGRNGEVTMAERDLKEGIESLKEEIEGMLSLVDGGWMLRSVFERPRAYRYEIIRPARRASSFYVSAVTGRGCNRYFALRDLLMNWRNGKTDMRLECPAGSTEELSLKLAIRGNDDGGTRS